MRRHAASLVQRARPTEVLHPPAAQRLAQVDLLRALRLVRVDIVKQELRLGCSHGTVTPWELGCRIMRRWDGVAGYRFSPRGLVAMSAEEAPPERLRGAHFWEAMRKRCPSLFHGC